MINFLLTLLQDAGFLLVLNWKPFSILSRTDHTDLIILNPNLEI